jgi:multiple sugar transport system permease protein
MTTTALTRRLAAAGQRRRWRENLEGYLWAAPWFIGFVIFIAGPMIASLLLSFTRYDLADPPRFIGLDNYSEMAADPRILGTLIVTTIFALVTVPTNLLLGLGLALLVNMNVRGIAFWRTIYYLPAVTPAVAYAQIWVWIFNRDYGLLNYLLSLVGINGPSWLTDPDFILPALIIMTIWGVGASMIINLAGLQSIPTELFEAAAIDGANGLARFRHITIPMMSPVIFYNLVIGVIGALQSFTTIFIVTRGGTREEGMVFMIYLYQQAFGLLRMGYASAMAWLLFVYIVLWTLLIFRTGTSWVYYEGQRRTR